MSDSSNSFPLQERITHHSILERLTHLVTLLLLIALLLYRLLFLRNQGCDFISVIAFMCESWFTFYWFLILNGRWNPVSYKTYPQRLLNRFKELPAVDIFITTADPVLEPPIITANTMVSLLSVDYPTNRLACYVSDDGGSPITYYAIKEASKFAKLWVPFCKKYSVQVRAPFVYFSTELLQPAATLSKEFVQDWKDMKMEYHELCSKVEGAAKNDGPFQYQMKGDFSEFFEVEKGNHPSIIKVISENNGEDDIPHVIYVAREKRAKHPHHYKAGAMNVLTRISGVMTNAPFILNVDCDMFANNPEVILHSMCLLLGFDDEISSGFVQAYQQFYGGLEDDPFGNQMVVLHRKMGRGIGGLQGPVYAGTGCIHRRKIIYGASPDANLNQQEEPSYKQLQKTYGSSKDLIESVTKITTRKPFKIETNLNLCSIIPTSVEIASCTYELNTSWGQSIGWIYGSVTEDILTGLRIHAKGWRSVYLTPEPPAFLGDSPTSGPTSLVQYKRWATGLLEILTGRNTPILAFIYEKLWLRQSLVYLWITTWALCGVVDFCYALLPAYCILTNSSFLPKASSVEFFIPFAIFTIYNISTLSDFLESRLTFRAWWNNQRMNRIVSASSFLFGFLSVILKILGFSETVFEVTKKDQKGSSDHHADENENGDLGRFTFDSSPIFVPATALLLLHIACVAIAAVHFLQENEHCWGVGEVICSLWLITSFWPFVRGLYSKGIYGIPWSVIWKALGLSCGFMQLCALFSYSLESEFNFDVIRAMYQWGTS